MRKLLALAALTLLASADEAYLTKASMNALNLVHNQTKNILIGRDAVRSSTLASKNRLLVNRKQNHSLKNTHTYMTIDATKK